MPGSGGHRKALTKEFDKRTSSSQAEKVRVPTFGGFGRQVLVVEVEGQLLSLEAELLVEQHRRVAGGHVKSHVLAHASLKRRAMQTL